MTAISFLGVKMQARSIKKTKKARKYFLPPPNPSICPGRTGSNHPKVFLPTLNRVYIGRYKMVKKT